ncbi:enolase C-terminal domain-like protein [Hankyongella ginsenosidimutans]|uniref:enolase C-terminal domain-like protein n=1 Tax=Hankyongella ginsenosidimutans TaxID=1763828 RepID=UPI00319DC007
MAAEAAQAAAQTLAPLLKIKLDAEMAVERITAVHRAAPAARLILDANESWTPSILQAVCAVAAENGAVLIEQPLPAGADQALVRGQSPVPICADESCHTHDDLAFIAPRYDAVNIKLDKCGGLTEAIALYRAARALDLEVMVGCMVGSSSPWHPPCCSPGSPIMSTSTDRCCLRKIVQTGLHPLGSGSIRLSPPFGADRLSRRRHDR